MEVGMSSLYNKFFILHAGWSPKVRRSGAMVAGRPTSTCNTLKNIIAAVIVYSINPYMHIVVIAIKAT
jgi:hypothetical protein